MKRSIGHMLKKIIASVAVCILVIGSLVSCGNKASSSSSGGGGMKILYIITDFDTFRQKLSDAVLAAGKEQGADITMVETGYSVETQVDLVMNAKSQGYDAIILRLADAETALQMNTASNGIPIVYLNSEPSEEYLDSNQNVFVGSEEKVAGQYQAEYVINKLGKKSMNIIIFEGEKGHSGTIGRTNGVRETMIANGVDANIVFMDYANWSTEETEKRFDIFMKTGQSVDAVFCNNDNMALGAINAMKKYGLDYTTIPVCGVDAIEAGCESILAGEMAYTVLQDADLQASRAVEAAIALGGGGTIDNIEGVSEDSKYIWVPFLPVDKSNASDYL